MHKINSFRLKSAALLSAVVLILALPLCKLRAEEKAKKSTESVRSEMHKIYPVFTRLLTLASSADTFFDDEYEAEIAALLKQLDKSFHGAGVNNETIAKDPGYGISLELLKENIAATKKSFKEENKTAALWGVRSISNQCISCHTRVDIPFDFVSSIAPPKNLSQIDQAEFYLATRQFNKAKAAFLHAVDDSKNSLSRYYYLKRWLLINILIRPNPSETAKELKAVAARSKFPDFEANSIKSWINSLEKWSKEDKVSGDELSQAQALLKSGLEHITDLSSSNSSTVDTLRASALLHKFLEENRNKSNDRAKALYLLGVAYDQLGMGFMGTELSERFLEKCIREYPGSIYAERAYRRYRSEIVSGFTGSGGVDIPEDVVKKLLELNEIAHQSVD